MAKRNDDYPVKIIRGSIFMQMPGFNVGGLPQGFGLGGSPKTLEANPDASPETTKLDMFGGCDKTLGGNLFGGCDNTLGGNLFGGFDPDRSARKSYKNQVTTVAPAPAPELDKHLSAKKSTPSQKSGRGPGRKPNFMNPESIDSDDEIKLFDKASLSGMGSNRRLEKKDTIIRDCLVNVYGQMKREKKVESSRGLSQRATFREQKQAKISMSCVSSGFDRVVELFIKYA
jgi:hypothetical protein